MDLERRLSETCEKGWRDHGGSLSADDLPYYVAWNCILSLEMNGLSGYLYNTLSHPGSVRAAVDALKKVGLTDAACVLERAGSLFAERGDADSDVSWKDVLRRYDPDGELDGLDRELGALDNYGIGS